MVNILRPTTLNKHGRVASTTMETVGVCLLGNIVNNFGSKSSSTGTILNPTLEKENNLAWEPGCEVSPSSKGEAGGCHTCRSKILAISNVI